MLPDPYGGKLVNLIPSSKICHELKEEARHLQRLSLSERSLCDLELLANGGFSPLTQFLGEENYKSVLAHARLANGMLWPIPITLPISKRDRIEIGQKISLADEHNTPLAIMEVQEKYKWDLEKEALSIYQTLDLNHPLIKEMQYWGEYYIAGKIQVFNLPKHADFKEFRYTPTELRKLLTETKRENVVAFQTRNPMHRAHEELTKRAMQNLNALLLLHPSVGLTKPGDIDYITRVRIYETLIEKYYPKNQAILSLLPLAMRMAGPREALLHMIIRRNYGANYFIIGRDHAGPGLDSQGKPFYEPDAAKKIAQKHAEELGIIPFCSDPLVYLPRKKRYEELSKIAPNEIYKTISGTEVREEYLKKGKLLPRWFTRPECAKLLVDAHPSKQNQGFCVLFTGLPCAGKTTIAKIVTEKLYEMGKQITFCDGDTMRKTFAAGLSFSLEDREVYLKRISFIATEVVKHRGTVIISAIYPLNESREYLRNEITHRGKGHYLLIFVDTPLNVCEERDIKGLYHKARAGLIDNYTGVSSPYEIPEKADIILDTINSTAEENAEKVLAYLQKNGYIL